MNTLNINGDGTLKSYDYFFNVGGKATDDNRNDVKSLSLTNLQAKFTNNIHTYNLGDTFESFSQYSLSTAVKGMSYRFFNEARNTPEVTLLYGAAYGRWDQVWRDRRTSTIERIVGGARIKYSFSPLFSVGGSLVRSQDDDRLTSSDELYSNEIYEMDLEYRPIKGLTIKAESAINGTKRSPQAGVAYGEAHGYAHKIGAVGDGGPSRVSLDYERVSPDFTTLLGSATPDREKFKAKWRYKQSRTMTVKSGFLWYRDSLDRQKSIGRTDYYKPEIGVTLKKLFDRKYASTGITYRVNIAKRNSEKTREDHMINLNYRDRFGLIDSDSNLEYISNSTRGSSRSKEYIFNTALNSRHTAGIFILKPAVYLGTWTTREELASNEDRTYEYSFGMGADVPKMKITSSFKVGINELDRDGGDDSHKTFGRMNVYYKPSFLDKLNYGMIFLRAYVNDFIYTTASKNFRETSITTGINIQI